MVTVENHARVHLLIEGRVQGVFFRANVRDKALELGLKGYAKNLDDGNVEVVAQGEEEKIDELNAFIRTGPGHSRISKIKIEEIKAENFKSFDIF